MSISGIAADETDGSDSDIPIAFRNLPEFWQALPAREQPCFIEAMEDAEEPVPMPTMMVGPVS